MEMSIYTAQTGGTAQNKCDRCQIHNRRPYQIPYSPGESPAVYGSLDGAKIFVKRGRVSEFDVVFTLKYPEKNNTHSSSVPHQPT